jgi:hypothetical protein
VGFTDPLTPAELEELIELTGKLRSKIDASLPVSSAPTPDLRYPLAERTVHTSVGHGDENTSD